MGDSLTAGNGILASNIIGDFIEYRGQVWSIGGDGDLSNTITLPNILKKFGQFLWGQSYGTGSVGTTNSMLNYAHPGDVASNMPGQANAIVQRLKLTLTCVTKTTGKSSPFSLVETICVITVTTRMATRPPTTFVT